MPVPLQNISIMDRIAQAENIKGQRLANETNQQKLDWAREDRPAAVATAAAEGQRTAETHEAEMGQKELDFLKTRVEIAKHFLPQVQQQTYPGYLDWMTNTLKLPSKGFLPPEQVQQMTPEQFEQYKGQLAQDADALNQMNLEQMKAKIPKRPTLGDTREIQRGTQSVTEAWDGEKWVEKGKGPKWNPKESGMTEGQRATEYQRLRSDVAKKWGYSEFSKIDENTAPKIEEATTRARELYDTGGMNMDEAIRQANQEVRLRYALAELPEANQGTFSNNKAATAGHVKELKKLGMGNEEVLSTLVKRGWKRKEAADIMREAGVKIDLRKMSTKSGGGASVYSHTATNPETGQKVGYNPATGKWEPITGE